MSEESKDEGASAPSVPQPAGISLFVDSLHVSDRIALAALITAIVAILVAVVQTAFMWVARNDEVEAALRAEQLRGCAAYRVAAFNLQARARWLAVDGVPMEDEDFGSLSETYMNTVSQLSYLLPAGHEESLTLAENGSADAWAAYVSKDRAAMRAASSDEGAWARAHAELIDICHSVIRDVRDR